MGYIVGFGGTHFRVFDGLYGYLKNILEMFKKWKSIILQYKKINVSHLKNLDRDDGCGCS